MNKMMFEKREDGRIKFNDTSRINYDKWCKLKIQLNHLGYEFEDENDVKDYFDRGTWLNLDQSKATLMVLNNEKPEDLFSPEQIASDIQKAKDRFGLTEIYEWAGYMLPDGSCLDFSDGRYTRIYDHRQIHEAISDSLPENYTYNQPMIQFMNYGCVRMMNNCIAIIQPLTREQKYALKDVISQNLTFYVDICNNSGFTVKSIAYEPVRNPGQIFCDIDAYFEMLKI